VSLRVIWDAGAQAALLTRKQWRTAAEIDAAVIRLAETGEGDLVAVGPLHHLRVAGHVVELRLDREGGRLLVLDVYRVR